VEAVALFSGIGIAMEVPEEVNDRLTGRRIFKRRNNMMSVLPLLRPEHRDEALCPLVTVAVLGLVVGGGMGFVLGRLLCGLTEDGATQTGWAHLSLAARWGLVWGLGLAAAATIAAYRAAVLDADLSSRSRSAHRALPLSHDEHFLPMPAPAALGSGLSAHTTASLPGDLEAVRKRLKPHNESVEKPL
jgi:hypothetical protein